jgi:hypothetical protein
MGKDGAGARVEGKNPFSSFAAVQSWNQGWGREWKRNAQLWEIL